MINTFLAQRNSQDKIIGRRFKFIAFLMLIFILIDCTGAYKTEISTQPESAKLVILHTNDMHAQYIPLKAFWIEGDVKPLIGGFGALDAYIKREREKGLPILLMDAGDLMTGTLLSEKEIEGAKGGALIKMMNEMGYDIMTLGNHEFDNGQENVAKLYEIADFPIVNANLLKEGKPIAPIYEILEIAGIKVGVIGLMTKDFYDVVMKSRIEGLELIDLTIAAERIVKEIDPFTDLIILLTHAGVEEDKELAREVTGVDIIIGGHGHTRLEKPLIENRVIILQTGSRTANLGRLEIVVQGDTVSWYDGRLIPLWVDSIVVEPNLASKISGFEADIKRMFGDTLATLLSDLVRSSRRESNVGSWVASIIKSATNSDFAIMNSGGIRKNVSAGPLTRLDIKEMLPFENTLVTFDVTGEELLDLIKFNIESSRKTGNEQLQFSGLSYKYRISGDKSELLGAWVNGKEIDPEATYKCGSIDFVLFSQSELYFGFTPKNGVDSRKLLSEATIEFLSENKVIDANLTGAIIRLEE